MSTRVILYTLNQDGTIPDYVSNGGYFPIENVLSSPQDYNLLGICEENISTDNLPENCIKVFSGRDDLEEYIDSITPDQVLEIVDGEMTSVPKTPDTVSNIVDYILSLQ